MLGTPKSFRHECGLHFRSTRKFFTDTTVTHNWADDLIQIVNEPMNQTLDRMRRFSNSISNIDRSAAAGG